MMRPKFWIYPYHVGSQSVQLLKNAIGARLIRVPPKVSKYRQHPGDLVINWGSSRRKFNVQMLNSPDAVAIATSKMQTLDVLTDAGVPCVSYTTQHKQAVEWNNTCRVLGRDKDRGKGGQGITCYAPNEGVGYHAFYVKYWKKKREFRIHVVRGQVIFQQEKLKKKGAENVDKYVRSHRRGWCFAFHHLEERPVPQQVVDVAKLAVLHLGLDFGAVDIGWNEEDGAAVFEVNTAPGIEQSTLAAYIEAFQRLL